MSKHHLTVEILIQEGQNSTIWVEFTFWVNMSLFAQAFR